MMLLFPRQEDKEDLSRSHLQNKTTTNNMKDVTRTSKCHVPGERSGKLSWWTSEWSWKSQLELNFFLPFLSPSAKIRWAIVVVRNLQSGIELLPQYLLIEQDQS
jgi:hypothetical protein